jgi:hypothetical protein
VLKAVARQRLAAGQGELDLGPGFGGRGPSGPLPITSSRMGHLLDALGRAYEVLGFGRASGGDVVFGELVLARIIEPASKLGSLRVLEEAGVAPASYATLKRRLPAYATASWRQKLAAACSAHAGLGPASLVLYDVSTLYFETDAGTGSARAGSPRSAVCPDGTPVTTEFVIGAYHRLFEIDQEVRPDRPPLPHHRDPGRKPRHHSR